MNKLKRKKEETLLQYAKRLVDYKFKDRENFNYEDIYFYILGIKVSRTEARKRLSGIRDILNNLDLEEINEIDDKEVLDLLESKTLELEKERKKKQAVMYEYNKFVRDSAREELWWEKLNDALKLVEKEDVPKIDFECNYGKEGLLTISDMHYGKEVEIHGLDGEIISKYNNDIFKDRMWNVFYKTIECCKINKITTLYIFNLADCIDGILRISQLRSLETGVIDSVLQFSEFMATWLNEFQKHKIKVKYYSCWGNHDEIRLLTGKKGDFPNENVNKLIMKYLSLSCKDNKNVEIKENYNSPFIYENICEVSVLGYHGEDSNLINSIRWFRSIYKKPIDVVFGGHLHSMSVQTEGIGTYGDSQCIRVPSICGIDDFSMKLQKSARAGANMFIFEEGLGKTQQNDFWLN